MSLATTLPSQSDIEKILCRPLTSCESDNLLRLMDEAIGILESELCYNPLETGIATLDFEYNESASWFILRPFTDLQDIRIVECGSLDIVEPIGCSWIPVDKNGAMLEAATCYVALKRCQCMKCALLCSCKESCKRLRITANWGCNTTQFNTFIAEYIKQQAKIGCTENVKSKSIGDISVTYDTSKSDITKSRYYTQLVNKWSMCYLPSDFGA